MFNKKTQTKDRNQHLALTYWELSSPAGAQTHILWENELVFVHKFL